MPYNTRLLCLSTLAMALLLPTFGAGAQDRTGAAPELTSEFVYKYLVAEIGGQRGEIGLAGSLLYELAKSSRDARLAERAARAAAYGNQPQLALRAANLWIELDPASTEARQAVTQMLLREGKLSDAQPLLQKLLENEETRANGFMYLNGVLARHADKAAALKLVQALAKPYPDLPEAHFAVAHAAWANGKADLALAELVKADALHPGWELAALLQGQIHQDKSPEAALRFYQAFLDENPSAADVRLAYAKLLTSQNQFDAARAQFTSLLDAAESNPEMAMVVGLLSVQLGDFAKADQYLQQALERGHRNPDQIHLYLGQSAEQQQRPEQAMEWYGKILDGERYLDAQLHIASLLAKQGKLDEARAVLHKLPDLSGEQQATAYQLEASLLVHAKRYQEAYDLLEKAVSTLPNTPGIIYDFSMIAERVGRYDVMERQLRVLIQIKPDYAQAYNALGYTLADRNERLSEAVKLIEKALTLSPDSHYILDSMGWVQYRLGRLDKAADFLRRAYSAQTDPEIAAHLGEVLWQQGKRDEARKTWDEALREFPDNELLVNTSKKFAQ